MYYKNLLNNTLNNKYIPSILSAILTYCAFPPINQWGLIFISLLPFLWGLKKIKSLKDHLLYFFYFGVLYMGCMHIWLLELRHYSSLLGIASLLLLYTLFLGLYYAISGALYYVSGRQIWLLPFCWIIGEWLRSKTIIGNPTGIIGYSQAYNPVILQWAGIIGLFGVSFIVIGLTVLLYKALTHQTSTCRKPLLTFVLALILVTSIGLWQLKHPLHPIAAHTISIIQGNHSQHTKLNRKQWPTIINDYIKLTESTLQKGHSQFIIWPETITPDFNTTNPTTVNKIHTLAQKYNTTIIFGSPIKSTENRPPHYFNSLAIMTPNGLSPDHYHKIRLMPFGEYWPGKKLLQTLNLGQLIPGSNYSPGSPDQLPLLIDNTRIGIGICLESLYPWFYQRMKNQNSQFMLVLANNAWFNASSGAEKHFQMSLFRAVENQSYFIQAANTGISAIISPKGIPIQKTTLNTQDTITGTVLSLTSKSIYNHIGDIIIYIGLLLIIIKIMRFIYLMQRYRHHVGSQTV